MTKTYRPIPSEEISGRYSPQRKARIAARASELLGEHFALRDIRKLRALTQDEVAQSLGGKQVQVSRIERRADVKLSTLRGYVRALGGELQLIVTFPDHEPVAIGELAKPGARRKADAKGKAAA